MDAKFQFLTRGTSANSIYKQLFAQIFSTGRLNIYVNLRHSWHFSLSFSKNSILGFCHQHIKLDPLNPKTGFLFCFEAPGRCRRHLQGKLGFFTFVTSPLACLTNIPGEQSAQSGLVINVQKCNFTICKCLLCLSGATKPKKKTMKREVKSFECAISYPL